VNRETRRSSSKHPFSTRPTLNLADYKTSTLIRTLLVRKWVDMSCLDFGVTNGMVYITGTLRHHLSRANQAESDRVRAEELSLAIHVERSIRGLPGVRDIIFRLSNLSKRGSKWTHRNE